MIWTQLLATRKVHKHQTNKQELDVRIRHERGRSVRFRWCLRMMDGSR